MSRRGNAQEGTERLRPVPSFMPYARAYSRPSSAPSRALPVEERTIS